MKNVLQEQLLKAGLATEDQIDKANKPRGNKKPTRKQRPQKPNKRKPKRNPQPKKSTAELVEDGSDLSAAFAARRSQEQKETAQKKAENERRKANKQAVNNLIKKGSLDTSKGDIEYQFVVGSSIKKIWVTEDQKQALLKAELGVTFLGSKRCLISVETIEAIRKLDDKKVISVVNSEEPIDHQEHAVPDDLVW